MSVVVSVSDGVSFFFKQGTLEMIEVENVDFLLPKWFPSASLRAVEKRAEDLQCQVLGRIRRFKDFAKRHPVIAMFLAFVSFLGFFPIFLFLTFLSVSLIVIFTTASAVFLGVIFVSTIPFLSVLISVLAVVGTTVLFIYFACRSFVKILQVLPRWKKMVLLLPLQLVGVWFRKCPSVSERFDFYDDFVPTDEELFDEEFYYGSDSE